MAAVAATAVGPAAQAFGRETGIAVAALQSAPDATVSALLNLLDHVQAYGGPKQVCLFPRLNLSEGDLATLADAARKYDCTLHFGQVSVATAIGTYRVTAVAAGKSAGRTAIVAPDGQVIALARTTAQQAVAAVLPAGQVRA